MANRDDNLLVPLQSVGLSGDEKERLWDNIVRNAEQEHAVGIPQKRKSSKRTIVSGILVVTAALALVGYTEPQILNIGKTFNLLNMKMFSTPNVTKAVTLGYGEKVNQSVTSEGITLTIGNIYADPTKLVFDMVESFASSQFDRPVILDKNISLNINDTRQLTEFSGGDFQSVSGGKYAGIVYFPVMNDQPYEPLPETFTLNVHIQQIGDIKGNWSFSIPVSQQKLQNNTKSFHPNVTVSNNGYTMKITNVTVSPVQTVMQGTMIVPANMPTPDLMQITDNKGQVIGGRIESTKIIKQNPTERITQMTIVGNAPSNGATQLSITPMQSFTTPLVPLQGAYPKTISVLPGLEATITSIDFNANNTVVHLSMNQAVYKHLSTYNGHSLEAQFFLVNQSATSSDTVGSKGLEFDSPTSNTAQITFGKVDSNKQWNLQNAYVQAQSGLVAEVPLK